jgi:hypothetical protein
MPAPTIAQPYECDTKVRVTGILDGALLDLHTDRPQGGDNIFHGNDVSFSVLPLNLGEAVTGALAAEFPHDGLPRLHADCAR